MAPDIQESKEKKRPLIQAEILSPGPGRYALPTTIGKNNNDPTKKGAPSFSFGTRQFNFKSMGPGPIYGYEGDMTSKGRQIQPAFSILGRAKITVKRDTGPGPGAYNIDRKPLSEANAPAYSISPRTSLRKVDATPSPLAYNLPTTIGPSVPNRTGGPAFRLYGRNENMGFARDLARAPGPAAYPSWDPSISKKRAPAYSLGGRPSPMKDKNATPGPGAYSPESVHMHLEQSPGYAIGVRHSQHKMPVMTLANVSE